MVGGMVVLRRNILIFHQAALGDFVLTWPLALALSRLHPQSRVVYVTQGQKGALAGRALGVESADIELGWHHLHGDGGKLPEGARKKLVGAHSIYSFVAREGDGWTAEVRKIAPEAEVCCLEGRPGEGFGGHASEFLVGQLGGRPAVMEAVRQMLLSLNRRGLGRGGAVGGPVVIHPGAGAEAKRWPAERFVEVARRLGEVGRGARVVMGEVERERWGAERVKAFEAVGEVRWPGTPVELFDLLSDAAGFVGNDSGPGHLAGVMGLPTLSLFGPTEDRVWRPLGPGVGVLRAEAMEGIGVEAVWGWLEAAGLAKR